MWHGGSEDDEKQHALGAGVVKCRREGVVSLSSTSVALTCSNQDLCSCQTHLQTKFVLPEVRVALAEVARPSIFPLYALYPFYAPYILPAACVVSVIYLPFTRSVLSARHLTSARPISLHVLSTLRGLSTLFSAACALHAPYALRGLPALRSLPTLRRLPFLCALYVLGSLSILCAFYDLRAPCYALGQHDIEHIFRSSWSVHWTPARKLY